MEGGTWGKAEWRCIWWFSLLFENIKLPLLVTGRSINHAHSPLYIPAGCIVWRAQVCRRSLRPDTWREMDRGASSSSTAFRFVFRIISRNLSFVYTKRLVAVMGRPTLKVLSNTRPFWEGDHWVSVFSNISELISAGNESKLMTVFSAASTQPGTPVLYFVTEGVHGRQRSQPWLVRRREYSQ